MKILARDLSGFALDWAVANARGQQASAVRAGGPVHLYRTVGHDPKPFTPSTDWAIGGPLIEREEIEIHVIPSMRIPSNWADCSDGDTWCANVCTPEQDLVKAAGPTPLVAAMRVLVASKLGDSVDVPDALVAP